MSRLYASARKVLEEAGYDPDEAEIEGTGKAGSVTKKDATRFVAANPGPAEPEEPPADDEKPTQADIIRAGLVEGLTNEEILEQVRQVHPDTRMTRGDVSVLLWEERNRDSAWWKRHWEEVVSHRPRVRGREEA